MLAQKKTNIVNNTADGRTNRVTER